MVKNKNLILLLLSVSMLFLCSCSNIRSIQLSNLLNKEGQKIQTMSEEIIRCLTEKDRDALVALFCEQVRSSDKFNKQVDELFAFFECDSYTKSEINTTAAGGESIEEGKRTEWYVIPEITYIGVVIVPDKDYDRICSRYYGVSYYWQITDVEDPSLEGLHSLSIELLNTDKSMTIGTNPFQKEYE